MSKSKKKQTAMAWALDSSKPRTTRRRTLSDTTKRIKDMDKEYNQVVQCISTARTLIDLLNRDSAKVRESMRQYKKRMKELSTAMKRLRRGKPT